MHHFFVRSAYPWYSVVLIAIILMFMIARRLLRRTVVYRYSLGHAIKKNGMATVHVHKKVFYMLRVLVLLLLALAIAKPQIVDSRSQVPVAGIDIILVLDVSGSMQFRDYDDDERSRFEVAKAEASRFIEKRTNDALGLVLFGKDAVSRCPITFDKELLQRVVEELKLGVIDSDGTMLITGIITAANRLKHSHAASKVMIVLTDGEPSEGDMDPSVGIDVAKKLGIKIYTVGIGSEQEQIFRHPLYGIITKPKVNKELLTKIASQTGGHYFLAHSAADMRRIYDTIDALEKTEHDVPMFSVYYDLLVPFVGFIMMIIFFELFFSTYVWFAL
ncbi:MAG TPA: VWA domain-containing protein [Candidatus Babeliales bacterium]|jgi:Ca-activated chloride channel family protein|nr:VWA domain-containing protein [Candidatus Babeliales bacterium]